MFAMVPCQQQSRELDIPPRLCKGTRSSRGSRAARMKSPAKFCKCRGCHRRLNAYDDKRSDKLLQVGEVQSEALSPWGLGSGVSKDIWRSN